MNVLFVFTNINGTNDECYSFGLASIISMTRASGFNPKVTYIKKQSEYSRVLNEIASHKPQVVGFSSVSSQFFFVNEIATIIKENAPHVLTVCGGVHPTINPSCVVESKNLDGIFVGESDYAFIEFLENVESKGAYKDTDNFAYAEEGKLVVNKLKPLITNLDELPYPDKELSPYREYMQSNNFFSFLLYQRLS